MKTATNLQENAEDIYAEAQQINEERAAKEAAEERIWAGRTPPADAPGPGRSEECTRYHMKNVYA